MYKRGNYPETARMKFGGGQTRLVTNTIVANRFKDPENVDKMYRPRETMRNKSCPHRKVEPHETNYFV